MAFLRVELDDAVLSHFKSVAKKQTWRGKDWWKETIEDALLTWADENDDRTQLPYGRG